MWMRLRRALLATLMVCGAAPAVAEELTIVGSGDGVAILEAVGESFSAAHRGVKLRVPKSIGSGGGIKAVAGDEYQLGRVGRPPKADERQYGLSYVPYAKTPVAFVVHKSVGISALSSQQLRAIYSGEVENWREFGGEDRLIRAVMREPSDSSRIVLETAFAGFQGITYSDRLTMAFSTPENFKVISTRKGSLGYGAYDVALGHGDDVVILRVDGKLPSVAAYPLVQTVGFVFKEENRRGLVQEFIDFATSLAAHQAIIEAGGIPIH